MVSAQPVEDVERQANLDDDQTFPQADNAMPDLRERTGQACFLCLENQDHGEFAVIVPCLRPTKSRRIKWWSMVNAKVGYEDIMPCDTACESDSDIYRRLIDACYQHLGQWKRWLPYYGVTGVIEVKFQFAGHVEPDGRYPICMDPINCDSISEECDKIISKHPTGPYIDMDYVCWDDYQHSDQCIFEMEEYSQPCIRLQAEEAEKRKKEAALPLAF